jgi:hypothetical protein
MIVGLQRLTSVFLAVGMTFLVISVLSEVFGAGGFPTMLLAQVVVFLIADLLFLKMIE